MSLPTHLLWCNFWWCMLLLLLLLLRIYHWCHSIIVVLIGVFFSCRCFRIRQFWWCCCCWCAWQQICGKMLKQHWIVCAFGALTPVVIVFNLWWPILFKIFRKETFTSIRKQCFCAWKGYSWAPCIACQLINPFQLWMIIVADHILPAGRHGWTLCQIHFRKTSFVSDL